MLTLHSMKYILIDFTMTKNPICVLPYMYDMAKFRASADFLYQRKPLILSYFLKLACLSSLFDAYCNSYGHTNHGVVSRADQAHHLNVSRYGRGSCELCV